MEKEKEMELAYKTVPQIFMESVEKYGDRVALRHKELGIWKDISWNEYYDNVKYISLALMSMGLQKGDKVAIIGDNCFEWVYIDMGIVCAGGVTVGIYTTNSPDECEYIINHSESMFYFVENEEQLDKWLQFTGDCCLQKIIVWDLKGLRNFKHPNVITLDSLIEIGKAEVQNNNSLFINRISEIKPDDLAFYIYTSGTTGRPKAAMLTHTNASWISKSIGHLETINDQDEVLSYLPLCHVFERLFTVFVSQRYGFVVNFVETLDTVTMNMREISPTIIYAVPRLWEKYYSMIVIKMSDATLLKKLVFSMAMKIGKIRLSYINDGRKVPVYIQVLYSFLHFAVLRKLKERLGFERVRLAYSGAAPISPDVLTFFNVIGMNMLEGYGQTEGTGVSTVNSTCNSRIGTVGHPLDGVELKIADDGEILVKSPGVFKGYFKEDDLTKSTLIDGWLYTGDVGKVDEKGFLNITGRKKDIIITAGGKNITPQYIEGMLVFSPYINDAIIIGDNKKYITALIVLDEENAMKYAQDNKIQFSTYNDLAKNQDIVKLIQGDIDRANNDLARVEQIKKFTILPHKLYQEEGDVTPTMKLKRSYVQTKYKDLIDKMY
ncbi:AMP-dependent synthetase/ligase [Spirochaetota bacterium]